MTSKNQIVINDFRKLLRHFRSLPSVKSLSSPLRISILNQIQKNKNERDNYRIQFFRATLHSYVRKISAVNELKYLRSLDSGEKLDPRDKIRATASRVGLSVPKFADEA
eukprot:gene9556-12869_t